MPEPKIPVPANLQPYVEALGEELAIVFLLEFGGAELYLPSRPQARGRLARLVGEERAAKLTRLSDRLPARVPLGSRWIARVWYSQGLPKAEIARRLRKTDVTVRDWLNDHEKPFPAQASLF